MNQTERERIEMLVRMGWQLQNDTAKILWDYMKELEESNERIQAELDGFRVGYEKQGDASLEARKQMKDEIRNLKKERDGYRDGLVLIHDQLFDCVAAILEQQGNLDLARKLRECKLADKLPKGRRMNTKALKAVKERVRDEVLEDAAKIVDKWANPTVETMGEVYQGLSVDDLKDLAKEIRELKKDEL